VRTHPRFVLYSFGSGWVEQALRSTGAVMSARGQSPFHDAVVYEVGRATGTNSPAVPTGAQGVKNAP
jgi:hypothetical protein